MHDNVNTGSFVIFEWDDDKAAANLRKHHVAFELAELVWDDPAHIIVFDRYENDEERWHAIGLVRGILILTALLQTLTRFPRLGSCTVKVSCDERFQRTAFYRRGHPMGGALVLSIRSEEHTSELQSLMRISYAVFCLKQTKKKQHK